jgi:hypothetical protein
MDVPGVWTRRMDEPRRRLHSLPSSTVPSHGCFKQRDARY